MNIELIPDADTAVTSRNRSKYTFCERYWVLLIVILTPIVFLPVAFIGDNNAYLCFYLFLVTAVFWVTNIISQSTVSLLWLASILMISSLFDVKILTKIYIRNQVLETFGVMCLIGAIEDCNIHNRTALRCLTIFGCSHYKLSYLIFFTTMTLSMWFSSTTVCGFVMPLVKAILVELEKLGILEMFENINELRMDVAKHRVRAPTDLTTFYFLGVAYSSSIGAMTTLIGSETNQLLKRFTDLIFPLSPPLEFPHFTLLTLPGVLIMEFFLYFWLNYYFLGMFRVQNNPILQGGMSEDEIQYALAFLKTEYDKLGKFSIHEMVVGATIVLTLLIRTTTSYLFLVGKSSETVAKVCAPTIISVAVLCVAPRDLDFFKTFRNSGTLGGRTSYKPCLTWNILRNKIYWHILVVIVSSDAIFETFQRNHMMDEFEELLLLFKGVNSVWVVTTVILLCKVLTEFVSNSTLVYFLLRHVARVSVFLRIHPHFLMSSAVLAAALPFHTTLGTPANALVSTYVNIPHRKMLFAGSGLSLLAILVVWLTTALWSRVIWHDISAFPAWAKTYVVKYIDE